ncbi:hypothetical protein D9758_016951 [Tetrapyrgos nigripes]|uniref:Uncharacterized protein n=1 Tax=Tetrapyrgos nigripes TaxID=182062 RepID=A0A8H5BZI4_9AGAR|nr:hypothetical protein D9758_016951 [Tetrapyrgos nigripes]
MSSSTSSTEKPRKTAIVTGAAKGIGRSIALRLAQDGFNVAMNDVASQRDRLVSLSEEIRALGLGSESSIHVGDVSVEEEVKGMVEEVERRFGGVDVMIANAGISLMGSLLDTTVTQWDHTFNINVRGTFMCYKYAAAQMIRQGRGGRIVGASSLSGKTGMYNSLIAYTGTKFAIRGITQAAAGELGKYKITVNAYAPGLVDTEQCECFLTSYIDRNLDLCLPTAQVIAEKFEKEGNMKPGDFYKSVNANVPVGYTGLPDDIAGLVSYLVSDQAHFITGQSISINGGAFCD